MDNDRIGGIGVNKVIDYIWKAGYMKPDIHHHDNIPIWDGDIYVYSTEYDLDNNNFRYRLPVQVKSHFHEEGDFPDKAIFDIKTKNLQNYLAEGGVIFFLVFLGNNDSQIYVDYLTRKKIKTVIKNKEHQKSIRISLSKITTDKQVFLSELNSLYLQRRYSNRPIKDFNPNETIEILFDKDTYGLKEAEESEVNRFLATHPINILFKTQHSDELFYPEEGPLSLHKITECHGLILFGEVEYTTSYRIICTPTSYLYEIEDGWLEFYQSYDDGQTSMSINFQYTTYRETIRKIKILDSITTKKIVKIEDKLLFFPPSKKQMTDSATLQRVIDFWLRFELLCSTLHVYHDFDVSHISKDDIKKIKMLYAAYVEKKEITSNVLKDHLALTVIGDLRVVSWVKIIHGNKARLLNYADQMAVAYKSGINPTRYFITTVYTAIFSHENIASNIQLDNIIASYAEAFACNPHLIEQASIDLFQLIKHYDKTNRPELLKAAIQLSQWILENCSEDEEYIHRHNHLQLQIRNGQTLFDTDIDWLMDRENKTDSQIEKFICATLMREKSRAYRIFKHLSQKDTNCVIQWPIFHLYQQL